MHEGEGEGSDDSDFWLGQWVDGGDINWEKKYKKRKFVGLKNKFSFAPNFGMRHLENGQVDVSSRQ